MVKLLNLDACGNLKMGKSIQYQGSYYQRYQEDGTRHGTKQIPGSNPTRTLGFRVQGLGLGFDLLLVP